MKEEDKQKIQEAEIAKTKEFLIPSQERDLQEEQAEMYLNQDNTILATTLLRDGTPPAIKKHFWALTDKENALTNFDISDIKNSVLDSEDIMMNHIMTRGEFEYTFKERLELVQLKWAFNRKIMRSKNGFERNAIVKHITERRIEGFDGGGGAAPKKRGIISKIFRRG